jgi:hypothetical protein
VRVVFAAGDRVVVDPGGPGLSWRKPSAKLQTASRSCLLAAQRKVTALCFPDWRVEGAAPARQMSDSGSGNLARQSPISVSSRAARTVPERGSEVKMCPSAWPASWSVISASSALIWVFRLARTAVRARVIAAAPVPDLPRAADASRRCSSAGLARPPYPAFFSQAARRFSVSQSARSSQDPPDAGAQPGDVVATHADGSVGENRDN